MRTLAVVVLLFMARLLGRYDTARVARVHDYQ